MPIAGSFASISARGQGTFGRTVAQITNITDNFNRGNGALGFTSDGLAQWQTLQGTIQISSNTATSSNSSALAIVDLGASNVTASLSISWAGDALYFRVVDANNWWRVGTFYDQVTTSTPYNYSVWNWYSELGTHSEPGGAYGCPPSTPHTHPEYTKSSLNNFSRVPTPWCVSPLSHTHPIVYPNCTFGIGGPNRPVPISNVAHAHAAECYDVPNAISGIDTTTENYYYVLLERCSGGSVSQIRSYVSTYAFTVTSVQVTANGSSISVKYNGSSSDLFSAVSDSTHSSATKHGIGRRSPGDASSSSMDNFSVTRL